MGRWRLFVRLTTDVWQRYSSDRQATFVHEHFLMIGHIAWGGYLNRGRGLVLCEVAIAPPNPRAKKGDLECSKWNFLPAIQVDRYLADQGLKRNTVSQICSVVQTYQPDQEILLLINHDGEIEIQQLQNLRITPQDCYRQVSDRWKEFMLG